MNKIKDKLEYTPITLRLDSNSLAYIQYIAKENCRSISGEVNLLLKNYVKDYLENIKKEKNEKSKI